MVQQERSIQEQTSANSCWYCSLFNFARKADTAAHQQQQQQQLGQMATHPDQPGFTTASTLVGTKGTKSSNQSIQQLQQQLHQHQQEPPEAAAAAAVPSPDPGDCLGCRVTGLMLGLGGAGYVSSRLFEHPKPVGAHRYALIGVSAGLAALGIARAIGL